MYCRSSVWPVCGLCGSSAHTVDGEGQAELRPAQGHQWEYRSRVALSLSHVGLPDLHYRKHLPGRV